MAMEFPCPGCAKTISAAPELVGRTVACPFCAMHFVIPAPGVAPRPTARVAPSLWSVPRTVVRFTFSCQRCHSILEGNSQISGQTGRCPTCGATFVVPMVDRQTGLPQGPAVVEDDGLNPMPVHAYANAGDRAPRIERLASGDPVIVCPRCSAKMSIEANLCTSCGIPFTIEGATTITRTASGSNSAATAALVLGILSIPTFMCAPLVGTAALVLGAVGYNHSRKEGLVQTGRNAALAGLILGLISIGIFILVNVL